jgi:D-alanyl-D-alanine dipeptidase
MRSFATLLSIALLPFAALGQIKKPEPPPVKIPFTQSRQVVVVTTKDWNATQGTAQRYERKSEKAKWKRVGDVFPVVVGRTGLATTREDAWSMDLTSLRGLLKHEGDGKSPAGMFPLTFAFGTSMKPESLTFPYTRLGQYTECVDDVDSHHYNKIVGRDQVGIFDWKSSEKMLEIGPPYELGVFVAYNSYPVVKGNGSCIFLHIWKDATTPTAGCTAMNRFDLERIVSWLEPDHNPYLAQMPEDEYRSLRKAWNLPDFK